MRGRRTSVPEELRAGPFTVAEARQHGILLDQLRDRRAFRRLLHGVYVASDLPVTEQVRTAAAAKVLPPEAVFSHRTAARRWGIPVAEDDLIHVTIARSTTCPRFRRIRVHQTNEPLPWVEVDGQRVTPPERTFVDLAAELGLVDLVVAGDRMLHDGLTDQQTLDHHVASTTRRRGTRNARTALDLVRTPVGSEQETRLRLLLVLVGLPEPAVNTEIVLAGGSLRCTPALHYPRARIALEPTRSPWGEMSVASATAGSLRPPQSGSQTSDWSRDPVLLRGLAERGWRVLHCDTTDLWHTGASTVQDVHDALRARQHPGTPDTITRTSLRSAIDTLMVASEVAWTRVPRSSADSGAFGVAT